MAKPKKEADSGEESIEQLQNRYADLNTKKIEAGVNLENATRTLNTLKEEARQKFGTDDVADLQEKLKAMKVENEEKRKNYQAELDRIETELAAVEERFTSTEPLPSDTEEKV
jgi:chromosome segregation ATPase